MSKEPLAVIVLDDTSAGKCEAGCGTDWSKDEARVAAASALQARFGQRVTLSFCDLAQPESDAALAELARRAVAEGLSLPLLAIDGEPKIAGLFDVRMVADVVEAALEMARD